MTTYNGQLEDTKKDLQKGFEDVSEVVGDVATKTARRLKKVGSQMMEDAKESGNEYVKEIEAAARENPLRSAAIFLGLGFLFGRFICR